MVSKEILIEIVKTRIKIVFVFLICALFEVLKKKCHIDSVFAGHR